MIKVAIYAIYDRKAEDILGGQVTLHRHEATAVRMFDDIAKLPNSQLARHPQDHVLIRLGYINEELDLEPETTVVLEGSTWKVQNDNQQEKQP